MKTKFTMDRNTDHLYIGKTEAEGGVNGFLKEQQKGWMGHIIYTKAFVSEADAKIYYGENNYKRIDFKS